MSAPIILCDTAGMTNERWLECRAHGPKGTIPYTVGGSDVAAIFGVSPWTTPLELWMIKKGRMKAPVKSNQEGFVTGMAAKMFTVAGPVITFGTLASVIYGVILMLLK